MDFKKKLKFFCLIPVVGFLILFVFHIKTLDLEDIDNFKVEKLKNGLDTIQLSGYVWHSALGIYHISDLDEDHSLQVLVYCGVAMGSFDGNLSHTIRIPKSVGTVTFGIDKTVIWSR